MGSDPEPNDFVSIQDADSAVIAIDPSRINGWLFVHAFEPKSGMLRVELENSICLRACFWTDLERPRNAFLKSDVV